MGTIRLQHHGQDQSVLLPEVPAPGARGQRSIAETADIRSAACSTCLEWLELPQGAIDGLDTQVLQRCADLFFNEIVAEISKHPRLNPDYEAAGKLIFQRMKALEYELFKERVVVGNEKFSTTRF
ncbi:MAG: hypothetical protein V4787_16530 [Pseudomonadota bacterium]